MATSIDVVIAAQGAYFFVLVPNGALQVPSNAPDATIFIISGFILSGMPPQLATTTNAPLNPPPGVKPGTRTFFFELSPGTFSPLPSTDGEVVAIANFNFDSTPNSTINGINLIYVAAENIIRGTFTLNIRCIHGSSLIEMKNNVQKRIDQIRPGDFVLSDGKYVKVLDVPTCWLTFQNVDHDALIFEPGSLGENEPHKRLIIDPGHPMCTKKEYEEKGIDALRPAGEFYEELGESDLIYIKKWTDPIIQEDPSRRYDLILEEPYNTYTANGIIVQTYGYKDHRYKDFV